MAVTIVQSKAGNTGTNTPASTSATLDSPTGSGNMVIIAVSADATVATPTDFTKDDEQVNNNGGYVFRKASGAGGETSWTLTPSVSASVAWCALEVSGLEASPVDQVVSAGSGTGATTRSTGTTGTTTQADEWLLAAIGSSNSSGATSSVDSFTNSFSEVSGLDTCTNKAAGTNVGCCVAVRTVAATATYETTATFAAAAAPASTGILVTYKIAAAGAEVTGTAVGAFTFTGTAAGVPTTLGTAAAAFTFTGTALGVPTTLGTAAAALTFTGTATGQKTVLGAAAGAFTFTGAASGRVAGDLNINPNPPPAIGGAVAHNLPTLAGTIS